MYVHMCGCVHVYAGSVHVPVCMHADVAVCACVCVDKHVCMAAYARACTGCVCVYKCAYGCVCVHKHVCMAVYACACMGVYVCTSV